MANQPNTLAGQIEVQNLTRTLGTTVPQTVLRSTSLRIHAGEFVSLTGPSGSGKSTLLYLLGLLDRQTSGAVLIEGVDASALSDNERTRIRRERLGFVFQFHFLLPEFSALENVMIPMLRRGTPTRAARTRAIQTLEHLGLAHLAQRLPSELSGGQQQRIAIARAVAGAPAILLADEPTGNLDSHSAETVISMFERLNEQERITIVMVTHDLAFAERAPRRIALRDGAVL